MPLRTVTTLGFYSQLKREVRYEILGVLLSAIAVLILLSLMSAAVGIVGIGVARLCRAIAGEGAAVVPFLLAYWGFKLMKDRNIVRFQGKMYGSLICLVVGLTVVHLLAVPPDNDFRTVTAAGLLGDGGGLVGGLFSWLIYRWFGYLGSAIILISAGLVGLTLFTELPLTALLKKMYIRISTSIQRIWSRVGNYIFVEPERITREREDMSPVIIDHTADRRKSEVIIESPESSVIQEEERLLPVRISQSGSPHQISINEVSSYEHPPLNILVRPRVKGVRQGKDINENIRLLEDTLESFGVRAKVLQVSRGPSITRYELQPAAGIKVSRIVSLADDISLALAAPGVRIEAPIPGKAAIGIEVPNKETTMVHLRDLLETKEFNQSPSRLTVAFGKDIAGNPIVADLAMMPHLLIAGSTGSGKSVCLNTLISSILYKSGPDDAKLLLIDPKMVELTTYNGIPHLLSPVVTNPKKAAISLKWLVREMERRYELFAATGVRDISRYNSIFKSREADVEHGHLPLILVVIDELADLMMVAPADVEDAICRLAQMARAAGIHLVVATQRPSVDVITGLIKANIPSRIAFAVSSQTDSRTILDCGGAEKLLGRGDMLFLPIGASKPIRVQGAYLSDRDVEAVVAYLTKEASPEYEVEIFTEEPVEQSKVHDDELLPEAVEILVRTGHASISLLQRRLKIGYARAARLIDIMERRGIVGGYEGSKPRQVLMTQEQFNLVFKQKK
ncbi:MAG: FtsK/SpoIIIE family DNA translocase [Candidatus Desulforudaceae bacterium]|jgi:S-DNA-T family DNA segregation ATPase FtsK/SpoIIIE|nr:DNA translocase FtsK [Bacillota bacterium]MBV1726733.1 DNA translocase FtsK [Desulforudis sp.]MDZ7610286.1 DNA translocase FtsK 4TM domain-containing protein [Eubacteriales bacterium]